MSLIFRTLVSTLLLLASLTALAEKPRFGDTISFALGGMKHKGKASMSSTWPDAPVDKLTFKDLGMSDETEVVWADFAWQFAERWQFRLNYSSFDGDGYNLTTEDGNFGGLDWEVGAALTTDFDMKLYIADLTWDFLKSDKGHLGVGVGLHAADLKFDMLLEVGAGIGGEGGVVEVGRETASVLAPLPNLSLAGGYMLGEKVYLSGQFGFFSLKYDEYDGSLFSARGSVEWRPWEHFGLGAAYQFVDLDVEVDGSSSKDVYDLEFYGPVLFLSVGF